MRVALTLAALAAVLTFASAEPAFAQRQQQGRPPAQPPPPPPEPPPGFFPCRTPGEICFIGVVAGANQVALLFTNAPPPPAPPAPPPANPRQRQAPPPAADQGTEGKPLEIFAGEAPGTPLDLSANLGRVVMLTGTLDPAKGVLTKAEVVEVASPLLSFQLKEALSGGGDDAPPARGAQGRGKR